MSQWPFEISDFEDRALAMCEVAYVDVPLAQEVLAVWYERSVSTRELRGTFAKLHALGLVQAYVCPNGGRPVKVSGLSGYRSRNLSFRATAKAVRYLKTGTRYVRAGTS